MASTRNTSRLLGWRSLLDSNTKLFVLLSLDGGLCTSLCSTLLTTFATFESEALHGEEDLLIETLVGHGIVPLLSQLLKPVILSTEVLPNGSDPLLEVELVLLSLGLSVIRGGHMSLRLLWLVDPWDTSLSEVALQLSLLVPRNDGLPPLAVDELGFDHLANIGISLH